ncbi:hypothetical protein F444_21556, partial [Phytophthora nicotianae P1976]
PTRRNSADDSTDQIHRFVVAPWALRMAYEACCGRTCLQYHNIKIACIQVGQGCFRNYDLVSYHGWESEDKAVWAMNYKMDVVLILDTLVIVGKTERFVTD